MKRVLVVDDSAMSRRILKTIMESAGLEVVEAPDGIVALERYFLEKPDVVLLDLVMSGMYGLDVLARLRQMDPVARVVVVSADVQTSSHQMAAEAGAAGFLIKPLDETEALAIIRKVLDPSHAA